MIGTASITIILHKYVIQIVILSLGSDLVYSRFLLSLARCGFELSFESLYFGYEKVKTKIIFSLINHA